MEELKEVLMSALMITSFVVVIMLFIELLNVFTQGSWSKWLGKNKVLQVVIASVLGLIPGCFGGFAAVGMWTHGVISFGALVAAMLSSVGDEAFVMLVQMPEKALGLFGILFVMSILSGWIVDKLGFNVKRPGEMEHHLVVHNHEHPQLRQLFKNWKKNLLNPSFSRMLLLTGLALFIIGMFAGIFNHEPHNVVQNSNTSFILNESWFNNLFVVLACILMVVFVFVDDHFLEEHLWKHIIRQHVPKIFFWTLGALTLIHFLFSSVELTQWVAQNPIWILVLAVIVGWIPESGPHLIFISLFLSGQIPFSILLANSITQDGHSTLPLLAESKRGFISVKLINSLIGLLVGITGYFIGF